MTSPAVFGFTEWPFRVVADREFAKVWADRANLKGDIERRLRRLELVNHATIQLLWADFGAGKTHALRYVESRCNEPNSQLVPVYTEVPVGADSFLDLFRRFAQALSADQIRGLAIEGNRGRAAQGSLGSIDLAQALRLLAGADPASKAVARAWLLAQRAYPPVRDLRAYGLSGRIEDDERAIEVLAALCDVVQSSERPRSLIWLVDEFQRVGAVPSRKRDAIGRNLVSLFNACAAGLHLVISSSVAQQSTAITLVPEDLRSRANTFPMLELTPLSDEDGLLFCRDLFGAFRDGSHSQDFPFTADSLGQAVLLARQLGGGRLTPRVLMQQLETTLLDSFDAATMSLPISLVASRPTDETES